MQIYRNHLKLSKRSTTCPFSAGHGPQPFLILIFLIFLLCTWFISVYYQTFIFNTTNYSIHGTYCQGPTLGYYQLNARFWHLHINTKHKYRLSETSNIRHKNFRPSCSVLCNAQTTPPVIPKWGGLESSGRRLVSSNGKTKRIAFLFSVKNKYIF